MMVRNYILKGGKAGRERLRLLSDVMGEDNRILLDTVGITPGSSCIDLGCGGGDVSLELARRTGPTGSVLGVDRDDAVLELARQEATEREVTNVRFERRDVTTWAPAVRFDIVYARFLVTHLADPLSVLRSAHSYTRSAGTVVLEDIDFRGHFAEPDCPALRRSVELYSESVRIRGADPDIGPRLPSLLRSAGFEDVRMRMFHPVAQVGGIKFLICMTLETIAETVIGDGLTSREDIQRTIAELKGFAEDRNTIMGGPRVFQAWGKRPHER